MVSIPGPPPDPRRRLNPAYVRLPAGSDLFRIYDPDSPHGPGSACRFRYVGPFARFDHHRGTGRREQRGIWYAGETLDCALVEAFDIGIVSAGTKRLARPRTKRELLLLDLRGRNATRAGTVAAVAASDHALSQPWSRWWWENPALVGEIDGLYYPSAHNGDPAIALYERGGDALELPRGREAALADPVVLSEVRRIALEHGLLVEP